MYREEITHYSECLNRDMHIMVYGHGGVPFLAFPTQDSLCHNYEEFGMIRVLSDYLEEGKIQYFVVIRLIKKAGRKAILISAAEPGSRSCISAIS